MFMVSRVSDFVVGSTNLYIWCSGGVYLRFRTSFEVEIQYVNSPYKHNLSTLTRLGDYRKCNELIKCK